MIANMKKRFLPFLFLLAAATSSRAQYTATFETLPLPGADTFYVNHSAAGADVGFADNHVYFPSVFDAFAGAWYQSGGFVYSNKINTSTSGLDGQYHAITGSGDAGSLQYAIAYYSTFADDYNYIGLQGPARGRTPLGVAVTNNNYAYYSMRDGDFVGKKFGGTEGNDPDYFKVIFYGFLDGVKKADSVAFYLADFRFEDNTQDYIVKTWEWVDLSALGAVDSITYAMASSDTGDWGINTPTYFCIDNLTMSGPVGIAASNNQSFAVYPNPARQFFIIESPAAGQYRITDLLGRTLAAGQLAAGKQQIATAGLPAGNYILHIRNGQSLQTTKISVEK